MDIGKGEDRVSCMERVTWNLTLAYVKQPTRICCMTQETQTGALCQPGEVRRGGRWEGVEEGGDICIPMADSC